MISSLRSIALFAVAITSLAATSVAEDAANKKCPIMTNKEIEDTDNKITYQGKEFYVCCGPCAKQFAKDPDYIVAVIKSMKSIPALADAAVPANVKLLEQRYCPFSTERLISPSCPTVEYKGVVIYLSKPGHVRTWNENPDKYAQEAYAKGLLPQLKGEALSAPTSKFSPDNNIPFTTPLPSPASWAEAIAALPPVAAKPAPTQVQKSLPMRPRSRFLTRRPEL